MLGYLAFTGKLGNSSLDLSECTLPWAGQIRTQYKVINALTAQDFQAELFFVCVCVWEEDDWTLLILCLKLKEDVVMVQDS